MKKLILSLMAAGLFSVPSITHASVNPYASISGGLGLMTDSTVNTVDNNATYNSGYLINGAIGLKADYAHVEAEVGYHNNNLDTWEGDAASGSSLSAWSYMANLYLDYEIVNTGVTPFLMGGLGLASVHGDDGAGSKTDDSVFAWQVGAGLSFKAANKVNIDVSYRYFATEDATLGENTLSIASHNIIAGVRFEF